MSVKALGLVDLIESFLDLRDSADAIVQDTLEEVAWKVLGEAKERTPVDTGFLRSSGEVRDEGNKFVVAFTAKYALAVHEQVEVSHEVGESKFLENAYNFVIAKQEASDILLDRLLEEVG